MFLALGCCLGTLPAQSSFVLPPGTAIPVVLTQTLEGGRTPAGSVVRARTLQVVDVGGGKTIPKGSWLVGEVVNSEALEVGGKPSLLTLRFDRLEMKGRSVAVRVQLRALADTLTTQSAEVPYWLDTKDRVGTYTLIGGGTYMQWDKVVDLPGERRVAYVTPKGVFGTLTQDMAAKQECVGTSEAQSVAIYSPAACGLYGYSEFHVERDGRQDGTIVLESHRKTIKLFADGSALLQVVASQ